MNNDLEFVLILYCWDPIDEWEIELSERSYTLILLSWPQWKEIF
jgi:hypothetical protein